MSAQRVIGGPQSPTDAMLVVRPGVDTLPADRREILRLLRAYTSQSVAGQTHSALWSHANVIDRDYGDLTKSFVTNFKATLESIESDNAERSTQRIRIRYGPANASGMLLTLYAVREGTGASWLGRRWDA